MGGIAIQWQGHMVNKTQPFRQHQITRVLKAAAAAGMSNPTVEVRLLPTGATITVGSGKPDKIPRHGKQPASSRSSR
jgi:hypothetical protein